MKAIDMAREIVRFIEIMDQNGLYFFNDTIEDLVVVYTKMKAECENPPQNRGSEGEEWQEDGSGFKSM